MEYKKKYINGKYIKDEHRYIMEQYLGRKLDKEKLPKTKICIECGKEFNPPIKHRGRNVLCSKECWIKHQKKVSPFQNVKISSYQNNIKIKTYNSIKEASNDVNGLSTNIVKCLKGKIKSAYGYQWKYE